MPKRITTKKVMVGNVQIGHQNKLVIQSMTNTKTSNVNTTVQQIKQLVSLGCELVRIAVLDTDDANALNKIVKLSPCPIVADIHYNYSFAIKAIESGVSKIRINPSNIPLDKLQQVVALARKKQVAIRIGLNEGSKFNNRHFKSPNEMIKLVQKYIKQFERWHFNKIIVSLKSSSVEKTQKLYQLASQKIVYPLHIGVTESGSEQSAIIKSTMALTPLLQNGIGDTIRISITGSPLNEPVIAKKILHYNNLHPKTVNIISCPTCGRLQWNLQQLIKQVEPCANKLNKNINIAIMGCNVNGVGECEKADVGVYGNKNKLFVYVKGKFIKSIPINKGFSTIQMFIKSIKK